MVTSSDVYTFKKTPFFYILRKFYTHAIISLNRLQCNLITNSFNFLQTRDKIQENHTGITHASPLHSSSPKDFTLSAAWDRLVTNRSHQTFQDNKANIQVLNLHRSSLQMQSGERRENGNNLHPPWA